LGNGALKQFRRISEVPAATPRPQTYRKAFRRRVRFWPFVFITPAVLLLLAFHFIPVGAGTYFAFTDWSGLGEANWVGIDNFVKIANDPRAQGALVRTVGVAACFLIVVNVVGIALAVGLNRAVKTRHLLRALIYAPAIISPLAVGLTWQYLLTSNGLVNQVLGAIGLEGLQRSWLADTQTAIWTVLVVLVWQYSGLAMVIYSAGLQSIQDEYYEAAALDGAGAFAQFRSITFPLLAPAITVTSTLMLVYGLRVFDQVVALTGGGPVHASETLATLVYEETFVLGNYGYGAALALTLTVLITGLSFIQLAILRRREKEY
jgi:raffinose/stachyose/melibiose transport system permease protein